jgi:proteic killer suppression protein
MIINWKSKKLQRFFYKGIPKGIDTKYVNKILYLLTQLNNAECPGDMNIVGYDFHALKGNKSGLYAIKVTANYRLVFGLKGTNVIDLDYEDYH